MRRAEVWWAELPPPVGDRPVVILTRDAVLRSIGSIVVTLVTRTIREFPSEVELGRKQGGASRFCVGALGGSSAVPPNRPQTPSESTGRHV
ncbi:MAG TPA: type II toxin-antitoxin system PemK/MazF family toxin [Thermoanaerobaculia bacterium]|nr:type II toxin-antitoxin system PemK/MazF family toxin [Thermoanaerobaculia bacterium]